MRQRPRLVQHIRDNAETIGAYLDQGGVLQGERTEGTHEQNPAGSSSEYESGDEAMDTDAMTDSPAPGTSPRLPGALSPGPDEHTATPPAPRGPRDNRPRFVVRSGFDARRFSYGGEPVTDLTVRLAIRGPESQAAHVRRQLSAGVRQLLNDPPTAWPTATGCT
ncbi:hypothetical protein [Streptomyces sp. HUAS ZL42]|uniref:hypothetical protein n=1 Tax=Streptomyces sp. HUAS ZL42 TaxID=3231715 RepID=UPI00345EB296